MVYKLVDNSDLLKLPLVDANTRSILQELTTMLTDTYGSARDGDCDDGGFVLYVEPGSTPEEIKSYFDYTGYIAEYITCEDDSTLCTAMYIRNNENAVVILINEEDLPADMKE